MPSGSLASVLAPGHARARLPDLGRLPLAPTSVTGDVEPGLWESGRGPSLVRRAKREYERALADTDPSLQNTLLTVASVANDDDSSKAPFAWTFHVNGLCEIVVRFPHAFPFEAPYYYVKTFGGVQTDIKEFLVFVANQAGGDVKEYVHAIVGTDLNPLAWWNPSKFVVDHVKRLVNDPKLAALLAQASTTYVHRD